MSGIAPVSAPPLSARMAEIDRAAKEFEGMFMSEMLSHMFSGIETDPVFGGGKGEEIFRSMLIREYGARISQGPGVGISDQIRRTMIEMQQKANGG